MGVHGLWELLAPVGRRVSVEILAGKKLAIDASIWMVQFMKAMRDEKGEMVRNAHLIGFFRRICKLLYLRTKPVFVFDGGTPALKRRTVIARRRQRENAQAKIRKTAEKLLLNQLKLMNVKELAKGLENQRQQQKSDAKGKRPALNGSAKAAIGNSARMIDVGSSLVGPEELDEMLAASIEAKKYGISANDMSATSKGEGGGKVEEIVVDVAKGKKVLLDDGDENGLVQSKSERSKVESMKEYQEKLDEMLAAAIAADEDGDLMNKASTSGADIPFEEEDSDEDEQMLLPAMHGKVDPAVLASLPPSMQLDLLVQMRERLMAENRQKYQKVKKAPEKFSELQIQAYLKTVAFRREIDEVQKAASGRGVGGVQTSRIASEANREFIFSSTFTGDKQVLASARGEGNGEKQQNTTQLHSFPAFVKSAASMNTSEAAVELDMDEHRNPDDNIEIYKDERGRFRIRNRHMGIRMTRDIQRNLDLMKEKERTTVASTNEMDSWQNLSSNDQFVEASTGSKDESVSLNDQNEQPMLKNGSLIEISFEDNVENKSFNEDDDIFTELAAGASVTICSGDNNSKEQSSPSASDSDWEEMPIERKSCGSCGDATFNTKSVPRAGNDSYEREVEWEETPGTDRGNSADDSMGKIASKGCLEEEADLQEAILRSLLDLDGKESKLVSSELEVLNKSGDTYVEENKRDELSLIGENATQQNQAFCRTGVGVKERGSLGRMNASDGHIGWISKQSDNHTSSNSEQLDEYANEETKLNTEIPCTESITLLEQGLDISNDRNELSLVSKRFTRDTSSSLVGASDDLPDALVFDQKKNDSVVRTSVLVGDKENSVVVESRVTADGRREDFEPEGQNLTSEMTDPFSSSLESSRRRSSYDVDMVQVLDAESSQEKKSSGNNHETDNFTVIDEESVQAEFTEADLEEEMLSLNQEFMSLGDEQRRLERNAESVSSEMFAECQELLQIFGLPYIIAPMEAEAQCAFMELSNLVDGVVTDDSDVFLFGGRSIYKNIFDDRKYVETYFMKDIEKDLGLTREKLINMALLLGSDYTEGVSGIGVVNAIEVMNAFPEEDGLQRFREWVESPDPAILGKTDVHTGSSLKKNGSIAGDAGGISMDDTQDIKQIFMDKHRNVSKNWHIPSTFPSEAVITAYSSPQVDRSTESFSWGKPDLLVLRKLCWEKFGWNSQKTDDLLLPVLKEYEKRETQLRMEAFYSFNERFAKIRSKRITKAVKGITRNKSSNLTDDTLQGGSRRFKRRVRPNESGDSQSDKGLTKAEGAEENQNISVEKATPKQLRKRGNQEKQNSKRSFEGNKRGRGRGRTQRAGRGRGKKGLEFELSDNSSDDDVGVNEGQKRHDEDSELPQTVRRSSRSRNPVNYNVNGLEDDDIDRSPRNKETPNKKSGKSEVYRVEDELADASVDFVGKKQLEAANTLFKDSLSGDDLQISGGFCADEAEVGQRSMTHSSDPCSGNKTSDDYLAMGGGFCMDESEAAENQDATEGTTHLMENDHFTSGIDFMDKRNNDMGPGESTSALKRGLDRHGYVSKSKDEHSPLPENVETDTGTPSAGALIAMPFLKRKKRT